MAALSGFLVVLLLQGCVSPNQDAAVPDLILHNGRIYTGHASQPWVEAISVRGENVLAIGESRALLNAATPRTRIIDLAGHMAMPGIIDAHDHPGNVPFGATADAGASPISDPPLGVVAAAVERTARSAVSGEWVQVVAGPAAMSDVKAARDALDKAGGDRPVAMVAWWGHGVILNSRGIAEIGLSENTRDLIGGRLDRDADGRITGKLEEYAGWQVLRQLQSSTSEDKRAASLRAYADRRLIEGVTSVQVMAGDQTPGAFANTVKQARLPIRLRIIRFPIGASEVDGNDPWAFLKSSLPPRISVSGIKWILDGTPMERLAYQSTPYRSQPGWRGRQNFTIEHLRVQLERALAGGEPLLLHAVGDAMAVVVLDEMERMAPPEKWRSARVRLEHADGITGPQIERARRLGIVLAQPRPTALFGDWLRAGIPVAYGSDMGFPPFVMLAAMTASDNPQAISREQGLAVLTRWPAYAEFSENRKGVLAPGMLADVAVLSQDVTTVPGSDLPRTKSLLTLVGGQIAYMSPEFASKAGRKIIPNALENGRD